MKQTPLPRIISGVFLLSSLYWIYLAGHTQMDISCDAIGYQQLGQMLHQQGFLAYYQTGIHNEPIYPSLIALAMRCAALYGIPYTTIMAGFGAILLLITQILVYIILRKLNVRVGISAAVLLYLGLSPALTNTAFSLFSEIACYPFILGIILASDKIWQAINQNTIRSALGYGALLGALFAGVTLVKAVFEAIFPIYMIAFIGAMWLLRQKPKQKQWSLFLACALAAMSFYYVPITIHKCLNEHFNGNFAITNRGAWALYGNTARRMEPLTFKRFLTALASAPGEGVCVSLFGAQECEFWTFRPSDAYGYGKLSELKNQRISPTQINAKLLSLSKEKIMGNPFQYALLMAIEGTKMFFWESTKIGFVEYPPWLTNIYQFKSFNNILRLMMAALSLLSVFFVWIQIKRRACSPIIFCAGLLILLYIFFYSFFFILTRYALPIAPLYLVSIGYSINGWFPDRRRA